VTLRFDTTKGRITQGFLHNDIPLYKERGLSGHTGVDWKNGYGKPVKADNAGQVYKVFYGKDRAFELASRLHALFLRAQQIHGNLLRAPLRNPRERR
jgi:murein DD-endopeptidase MepM/ murein hydrolase activator NlpD